MEIRQSQKLSQALSLTPLMMQSLHVLQLPLLELKAYLESQAEENPVLEIESFERESGILKERIERVLEEGSEREDFSLWDSPEALQKKHSYQESLLSKSQSLQDHLLKQLRTHSLNERRSMIAEFIIGNIDDNGYLNLFADEVISHVNSGLAPDRAVTVKDAEEVLKLIQSFDPMGVGARNLKECLLIQLELRKKKDSLAYAIVKDHLVDLIKKRFKPIAKKMKAELADVEMACREIACLEPKPGRIFSPDNTGAAGAETVDIFVEFSRGKPHITINTSGLPRVAISRYYLNLLKSGDISDETKNYLREKVQSAVGLIKAIAQREETIRKIVESIVSAQKDFFEKDDAALIRPLSYRDIARKVKRNESTISRVVNKKYIETPHGIFKLDYFFSKAVRTAGGGAVSQDSIKSAIRDLISEEDPSKPLRDGAIVRKLQEKNFRIARRTVVKYRLELKIPPYNQRRK